MKLKFLPQSLAAAALVGSMASATAAQIVLDPSFEQGTALTSPWLQASTTFGSPLCTLALCGTGTGTGPNTGDWWAWFGGVAATETGLVSQPMLFAPGTAQLSFQFENMVSGDPSDFIQVLVDATPVWTYNAGGALSGVLGYTQIDINLDAFANGLLHTLTFSSISGANGTSNFFVDDVTITLTPVPEPASWALMGLGIAGLAFAAKRKQR